MAQGGRMTVEQGAMAGMSHTNSQLLWNPVSSEMWPLVDCPCVSGHPILKDIGNTNWTLLFKKVKINMKFRGRYREHP